jgi:hypothetical protein
MLPPDVPPARPISACRRCRKLKIGCNRVKPSCSRCTKAKVDCLYSSVSSSSLPSSASACMQDVHVSAGDHVHISSRGEASEEPVAATTSQTPSNSANTGAAAPSLQKLSLYASSLRPDNGPLSSGNQAGSGRQTAKLTRDRAILSCMRCRKHKVRCDRKIPCGRCIKNKRESQCVYSEAALVPGRIISERHHETLSLIATKFIDSKWNATVRNGTHWNSLLYEVAMHEPRCLLYPFTDNVDR